VRTVRRANLKKGEKSATNAFATLSAEMGKLGKTELRFKDSDIMSVSTFQLVEPNVNQMKGYNCVQKGSDMAEDPHWRHTSPSSVAFKGKSS
jgi:hypothetical protein